ncbi:MAG TPA: hypothetical protein VND94_18665 [Terriglobia bacterium]|nr:hypothetical protein [Terriglobia bacterium]
MADTTISTRALTYRDPTVSAAAEIQLRRNRQRSFDALVDQAQRTADAAAQVSSLEQGRADGFRAAKEAADQQADQSNSAAEQQTEQAALAGARTGTEADNPGEAQGSGDTTGTAQTQPTVTFTAQQIAQEQLGVGLHVPPLQPADEAYRRAGAEPPLPSEDSQPSLFALAV